MPRSDPSRARERPPAAAVQADGGEAAAWIRDHLDAVYRYARRRLTREEAEDVAQESFRALFEARAAGRVPRDPAAYLFGVARRRVGDRLRRRYRRGSAVPLPAGWEGFDARPLPPAALQTAELRDLVHVALGLLRGPDAQLLLDRYRRGASVAEIAARVGATEKAVEMRLRRARQAFLRWFRRVGRDWGADVIATDAREDPDSRGEVRP